VLKVFLVTRINFSNRRLVNRLHDQFINVDVRRTAGDPDQNFRDVARRERIGSFINFLRLRRAIRRAAFVNSVPASCGMSGSAARVTRKMPSTFELHHRLPIRVLALGNRIHAMRVTSVIDENVEILDLRFVIFPFAHAMKVFTLAVFETSSS
jgi:hypothetical protein